MIDPNNIIDFNRTETELQELILFLVCVAGKTAKTVSKQLNNFLGAIENTKYTPFDLIKVLDKHNSVELSLRICRFGQYTKLTRAFRELANSNLDLKTCSLEDLIKIHGIGRKSASCFLAWTRKDVQVAMLDTHLLKYLAKIKFDLNNLDFYHLHREAGEQEILDLLNSVAIPKSTPSSKKVYDTLEKAYLKICFFLGKNPTEYDLELWRGYAKS